MNFQTWQDEFLKRENEYIIIGENFKGFEETDNLYKALVRPSYDFMEDIVYSIPKEWFLHLSQELEKIKQYSVKIAFMIKSNRIIKHQSVHFELIWKGNNYSFSFLSFKRSLRQDQDTSYRTTLYCHVGHVEHLDMLNKEDSDFLRAITPAIKEFMLNHTSDGAEILLNKRTFHYSEELQYFLNETPLEERYLLGSSIPKFMEGVEKTYHWNLEHSNGDFTVENVTDFMTEGLGYEGQSIGYKNPIYDAAYIWKLIEINKSVPFKDLKLQNHIFESLKEGLTVAFNKLTPKQIEELKTHGVTQDVSF